MEKYDKILARIQQEEGYLNVKDLIREGFDKIEIEESIAHFNLYKLSPNFYLTQEAAADQMFFIRHYSNDSVFSHETALYIHHLVDGIVRKWVVTSPAGYSGIHLRTKGVTVHFMKKDLFKLGIIETKTPYGRTVLTYNLERTICDLLRNKNEIAPSVLDEALKNYIAREDKDLNQLLAYAKQFRVEGILKNYSHLFGAN